MELNSWQGERFVLQNMQTSSGVAFVLCVCVCVGMCIRLPTHLHLVSKSSMIECIPPFPICAPS